MKILDSMEDKKRIQKEKIMEVMREDEKDGLYSEEVSGDNYFSFFSTNHPRAKGESWAHYRKRYITWLEHKLLTHPIVTQGVIDNLWERFSFEMETLDDDGEFTGHNIRLMTKSEFDLAINELIKTKWR